MLNHIIKVLGPDFSQEDLPAFLSTEKKEKLWEKMKELREIQTLEGEEIMESNDSLEEKAEKLNY